MAETIKHSKNGTNSVMPGFLAGGGETGKYINTFDWSETTLGDSVTWPQSLRTTLGIMLSSKLPMLLFWGPELFCFYNDAFIPCLGNNSNHSNVLGKPWIHEWPEALPHIRPNITEVLTTGMGISLEDQPIPVFRNGKPEDAYWSCSYSAVQDESGNAAGVLVACTETTEKITAFAKLEESEQRARNIVKESSVATCILLGKNLLVEDANESTIKIWGKDRPVLGRPLHEAFPELADQKIMGILEEVYATGIPYEATAERVQLLQNGVLESILLDLSFKPLFNTNGELNAILCTGIDVTEKVETQRRLENSEQSIRTLFSQAPVAISILKGPEFVVELANEKILACWGRSLEQVLNIPLFEALTEAAGQGFEELLTQVLTTGERFVARELPVNLERNGTLEKVYFNFVYEPYHELDGRITGIIVVANEITDTVVSRQVVEENEQKLRNIFEQSPAAMALLHGPDYIVENVNSGMLEHWGKTADEILGKCIFEVLPDAQEKGFAALLQKVYTTGAPCADAAVAVPLRRNGELTTVYVDFYYSPMRNTEGAIYGILASAVEVTDSVLAKNQLEESEYLFRTMVEQAPIAIGLMRGPAFRMEVANTHLLELLGMDESIIGKSVFEFLPEAKGQSFLNTAKEVFETGTPCRGIEVPINFQKEGALKLGYYNSSSTPLFENGEVTGILQVATEVTEQVLARKKLEESEEELWRFKFMADLARDPLILVREDGTFAYLNKRALEAWGYSEEEAKHIRVPDVDPIYQDEIFNEVFRKAQKETIPQFETLHRSKDGTIYQVEVNMGGLTIGGKPHILAVARNITKRKKLEEALKESEERFRIMADAAPNIVWALNPDGSLKYMNKFALEFFGISLEQFLIDGWAPFVHPEDMENTSQLVTGSIQQRKPYRQEVRMRWKDGSYRWLLSNGAPSFYPNGELYGYVGTAVDISELKAAQKAVETKNEQLLHINNDLDNFIYTASHDLKAPIANIEGFLELLGVELSGTNIELDEVKHILELMQVSVERFKKTIANLTEVVKLQKDNDGESTEVNLAEVIDDVSLDLDTLIKFSKAQIAIDLIDCEFIRFSEKNLRSIIYNLLSNALKYKAADRLPHIQVRCETTPAYYVMNVTDNGLGMNLKRSQQLFTMFKRFHDHVEGSGIGLYMVKKIVDNAGGRIEVDSEEGVGTTFRILFPR